MDYSAMVSAIRDHKKIGHGTCSVVDECCTDQEVIDEIKDLVKEGTIKPTIKAAIKWYIGLDEAHWEHEGLPGG